MFDDKFGLLAKGNDKGKVEGLVGYSRRHFMVPLPVAGLCQLERIDRERRTMELRIRLALFPVTQSLDTFDFMAMPNLNKSLVLEVAALVHELMESRHEKRFRPLQKQLTSVKFLEMNGESYRLATSKKQQQRYAKPNISFKKGGTNP